MNQMRGLAKANQQGSNLFMMVLNGHISFQIRGFIRYLGEQSTLTAEPHKTPKSRRSPVRVNK